MGNDDLFAEVPLKEDSSDYTRTANLFRTSYGQPHLVIEKVLKASSKFLTFHLMESNMGHCVALSAVFEIMFTATKLLKKIIFIIKILHT